MTGIYFPHFMLLIIGSAKGYYYPDLKSMKLSKSHLFCQEILNEIASANDKLKSKNIPFRIEIKGQRLSLRGRFPPKPYSKTQNPYQQNLSPQSNNYISNQSIHQSVRNIKQARREAECVHALILRGEFDWSEHIKHKKKLRQFLKAQEKAEWEKNKKMTFREIFRKFEEDFFKYSSSQDKPKAWKVLKRNLIYLDSDDEFSLELFQSKGLEFIQGKETKPAQKIAQKRATQFLNFLKREGFS